MKYVKCLSFIIIPTLTIGILLTILYYFDMINSNIFRTSTIIVTIISCLIGGLYLGKNTKNKGYLEGLKISLFIIIMLFLINYLGFNKTISLKRTIYYLIITVTTTFGSMLGIKNVDNKKL